MKKWFIPVALLAMAACDQEAPTEIGAGLLPPGAVRTFEVTLPPERYLVRDTAFGLYTDPRDVPFVVVARDFDGALTSHALVRFSLPENLTVTDTAGSIRIDTVPNWFAGTIRMAVDSAFIPTQALQFAVYRTTEAWHESATWSLRGDTAGVQTPWSVPGGAPGALVARGTLAAGGDTLQIPVDSATIAAWGEIADGTRGALIVLETPNARIRTGLPTLHLEARPSLRPDTVYTAIAPAPQHTYIFTPELARSASDPRVGGTPGWRTIYQLRERLDTISFACPGVPNCRVRLGQAHINSASLVLQPVPTPLGFRPELNVTVAAYLLLPSPQVPLPRSPIGDFVGFASVPAASFVAPAGPAVEIAMTDLIRLASLEPEVRGEQYLPTHFALLQSEPRTFGFGAFESMPPLRLVLSIARELQLP